MFKPKNEQTLPIWLLDPHQKAVAHELAQQLQQRRGRLDSAARLVAQQMQAWGLLTGRRQQIEALALGVDLKCQAGIVHLHHLLHAAWHDRLSQLVCDGGDRPGVEGHRVSECQSVKCQSVRCQVSGVRVSSARVSSVKCRSVRCQVLVQSVSVSR